MAITIEQKCKIQKAACIILDNIPGLTTLEAIMFIINQFEPILQEHEPGELITKGHCPNCGVSLSIEYGDDEGEIGIITN